MSALHITSIFILICIGLWPKRHDGMAAICAIFILVWCDLVVSALILSSFGELGNRSAYILVSLAIASILAMLMSCMSKRLPKAEASFNEIENNIINLRSRQIAWLAIAFVVVPTILICTFYVSNNYDSLSYRFPRAFFYIDQGSLSQIPGDFRIQFYPFNISLVYVWFAIHGLAGPWFNLFGFISWLIGGVAVWRFARDIGSGHTSALIASAIFITSPAVFVSASSTNDDLISGIPLLIGIMFLVRWWKYSRWFDATLAAIGIGLALGSKLHWVMMLPVATILLGYILYELKRQRRITSFFQARWRQIIVSFCVMLILSLPVFIINWNESGQPLPSVPEIANYPFSIVTAGVHSIVSTASLLFGFIPDLYIAYSPETREAFGTSYNNWFNKHLLFWLTDELDYVNVGFIFKGVGSSITNLGLHETTAWLGLTPWLLIAVILLLFRRKNSQLQQFYFWLALIFFAWHFTRLFMLKWVLSEGIYYSFSIALAAPAIAYLWEHRSSGTRGRMKEGIIKGVCIIVLATNLISSVNYFVFNYQRNLRILYVTKFNPYKIPLSESVGDTLRTSERTKIVYNQWGLPYFRLINESPASRYATSLVLPELSQVDFDLVVLMSSNTPIEFKNDDRSRLSLMGYYGYNRFQSFFGYGSAIDKLVAQQTEEVISPPSFALLKIDHIKTDKNGSLSSINLSKLHGIGKDEEFVISATTVSPDLGVTKVLEGELFSQNSIITMPTKQSEGYLIIKLMRRDNPSIVGRIWLPLNPDQKWLNITPKRRWLDINMDGLVNYSSKESGGLYGFVSGWSAPNINSYRWMKGATGEITFPNLTGFGECSLDIGVFYQGVDHAFIYLNGKKIGYFSPSENEAKSTKKYTIRLPDSATIADTNWLKFSLPNKLISEHRLGVNAFTIDCNTFKGSAI